MFVAFAPVTAGAVGLPDPRAVTAAIPLLLAAVLMWRRWLPRLVACLTLVGGIALSSGWLHTVVTTGVGWATRGINAATRTTLGGVAPGALAIVLLIFFVLEMRPESAALDRIRGRSVRAGAGRTRTHRTSGRFGGSGTRLWSGRPDKLAAAGVGLVLPNVAATMTGDLGAAVLSVLNLIGGAFAWPLSLAWGVA